MNVLTHNGVLELIRQHSVIENSIIEGASIDPMTSGGPIPSDQSITFNNCIIGYINLETNPQHELIFNNCIIRSITISSNVVHYLMLNGCVVGNVSNNASTGGFIKFYNPQNSVVKELRLDNRPNGSGMAPDDHS